MSKNNEVAQIKVGQFNVGIVGLKAALEEAVEASLPSDDEVAQYLLGGGIGPGCPNCEKLEQMVYQVMERENIIGSVEHVRDLKEITSYGLVGLPALVINGEVKSVGRFPRENQLSQWLWEARGRV